VTAQPADLLVVGGGPTGLGKPTSRPFSSTHSPTQTLEVLGHAVGKHLEVWNEVGVADDVEVQLAGVGQCPDLDGDVALDDADLEQLEDLGAGEVQGLLGAGEVAHEQVDPPLAVHGVNHPALQETRRGLVGRETFPFCCRAGYLPPSRRAGSSSSTGTGTSRMPTRFPACDALVGAPTDAATDTFNTSGL
jgi:hypothetical protein